MHPRTFTVAIKAVVCDDRETKFTEPVSLALEDQQITIKQLKARYISTFPATISSLVGPDNFVIVFAGKILDDNLSLMDTNLLNGSTLHCLLRSSPELLNKLEQDISVIDMGPFNQMPAVKALLDRNLRLSKQTQAMLAGRLSSDLTTKIMNLAGHGNHPHVQRAKIQSDAAAKAAAVGQAQTRAAATATLFVGDKHHSSVTDRHHEEIITEFIRYIATLQAPTADEKEAPANRAKADAIQKALKEIDKNLNDPNLPQFGYDKVNRLFAEAFIEKDKPLYLALHQIPSTLSELEALEAKIKDYLPKGPRIL